MASKQTSKEAREYLNNSYKVTNVPDGINYFVKMLLYKCQLLFIYGGLPKSIPQWEIEKNLILKGVGGVIKKNGNLYIPFGGSVSGFNEYYVPNIFTYAQPLLGSGTLHDGSTCAIIWNSEVDKIIYNSSWLYECILRYSNLLAHNESTMANSLINKRTGRTGVAQNSSTAIAVDNVLNLMELGDCKTITDNMTMFEGYKPISFNDTSSIQELMENRDYLLNCFYNEIGLQTLEEKRERFIEGELEVDEEVLNNNVLGMLYTRQQNVAHINEVFGTDITVSVNPVLLKGGKL